MSRYSSLYLQRGKPEFDSQRFRKRLGAFLDHNAIGGSFTEGRIRASIRETLGADVPWKGGLAVLARFFEKAEIPDILDAITLVFRAITDSEMRGRWRRHVTLALEEENLAYRLDESCVVHPYIDPEFEANRASALDALSDPKFGEARRDFEAAFRHLRNGEGKQAIRMMFPAVEVAARVLYPGAFSRLMPNCPDGAAL
jgi:hypothetical protein